MTTKNVKAGIKAGKNVHALNLNTSARPRIGKDQVNVVKDQASQPVKEEVKYHLINNSKDHAQLDSLVPVRPNIHRRIR